MMELSAVAQQNVRVTLRVICAVLDLYGSKIFCSPVHLTHWSIRCATDCRKNGDELRDGFGKTRFMYRNLSESSMG